MSGFFIGVKAFFIVTLTTIIACGAIRGGVAVFENNCRTPKSIGGWTLGILYVTTCELFKDRWE